MQKIGPDQKTERANASGIFAALSRFTRISVLRLLVRTRPAGLPAWDLSRASAWRHLLADCSEGKIENCTDILTLLDMGGSDQIDNQGPGDGVSEQIAVCTERLCIGSWAQHLSNKAKRRKFVTELAPLLSPPVLKHLPEPLQVGQNTKDVDAWITDRTEESTVLTLRDRNTAGLLGLIILAEFPAPHGATTIHLGYLLSERTWGQGYGTEAIAGLVQGLRIKNQPVLLLGGVEKQNIGSARVLEKNGFSVRPELCEANVDMYGLDI